MSYFEQTKITDSTGSVINPATDESILLLKRMVKLLESNATVDYANRQRIVIDSLPGATVTTTVPVSGTVALGSGSATIGAISTIVANGGVDPRYQFIDAARLTYDNGIRSHLIFS